jgi:hypothetical protein
MVINFFNFASEIRNKVYEELLFASDLITIELTTDSSNSPYMVKGPYLYPAVLLANKIAFNEASSGLYGRNCFRFGIDISGSKSEHETEAVILASFLDHIGLENARLLHSLCVMFPVYTSHDISPVRDTISTLGLIRDICIDIAVLEMVLETDINSDALTATRSQLDSILSLKDIKVYTYDGLLSENLIEMMRSWDWIVHVAELDEASDRFGSNGWGSDDDDYTDEYYNEETTALGVLPQRSRYFTFCDSDDDRMYQTASTQMITSSCSCRMCSSAARRLKVTFRVLSLI